MTANAGLVERLEFEARCWASSTFEDVQDGSALMSEAVQALTAAEAEIARLTRERDECSPYLKDGETPAQRIERLHGEISGMMKTLAVYTDRALAAEAALAQANAAVNDEASDRFSANERCNRLTDGLAAAEAALTETRAMLAEAIEALNYCEQYGSAAVKLLARSTLTKLQEAGHVAG